MNILYICEEYPPGKNGGIGTMVRTLGRELVKQGHNVYVAGIYPHGYGQADYEEDYGVKIWRWRYKTDIGLIKGDHRFMDKIWWRLLKYSMLLSWDIQVSCNLFFKFINELIKRHDIDIIEMQDWNTFLHNALIPVRVPQFPIPLVVKFNGSHSYFSSEMNLAPSKRIFRLEQMLMNRADALVSVSNYTAQKTRELFSLLREIKILYNSIQIPVSAPEISVDPYKVIFTGTLIKKKGIYSLLHAWNKVNELIPEARLHIYGKGSVEELKKILNPHSVMTVQFHGHVTASVLYEQLASATAAIFPSYSECFALAPLEAMAVRSAVINSSRSSGPELVTNEVNGMLVDPDNTDQIAATIIKLINDKQLRDRIAMEGRRLVEYKFNISKSAKEHVEFYSKTVLQFNSKIDDGFGKSRTKDSK